MADALMHTRRSDNEPLTLVLPDGARIPLDRPLTLGRDETASIRLHDATVSRRHAQITLGPSGPVIEDANSRFGVWVAGRALNGPMVLHQGSRFRLGDVILRVETLRPSRIAPHQALAGPTPGAGETVVVPVGATYMGLRRAPVARPDLDGQVCPRVRSGWALKLLPADEGSARCVLHDLRTGAFRRMEPAEAELFGLLDGTRSIVALLEEAERIMGPTGPHRLSRLVADLADRGLLDGIDPPAPTTPSRSRPRRVFGRREWTATWVADYFPRAYRRWGRVLFNPMGVTMLALLAIVGFAAFAYLVGAHYGTPFVVARRLTIGGAVFVTGRLAIVGLHELAHGLALARYGRRTPRGGVRLLLIFPYAFVDTSEAYLEPRGRRMVISAAGPVSDLTVAATFALGCAVAPRGAVRDVLFQLAFAGYISAFFNLNPFLDRDGYNILVDYVREPRLRLRARRRLARMLAGDTSEDGESRILVRYAMASVVWSAIGAAFAVIFSQRYYNRLAALLPHGVTLAAFIGFYVLLFVPALLQLGAPLIRRLGNSPEEVNRVVM